MYSLPQSYNQTSKCKRCICPNAYGTTPLTFLTSHDTYFTLGYGKPKTTFKGEPREGKAVEPLYRIKESVDLSKNFNTVRTAFYLAMSDILEAKKDSLINKERLE